MIPSSSKQKEKIPKGIINLTEPSQRPWEGYQAGDGASWALCKIYIGIMIFILIFFIGSISHNYQ